MAVINADGLVLGRLCTQVAKRLRNGEELIVVNAERAIVSGNRPQLLEMYRHRTHRASSQYKAKGPYYPKTPDRILKRTVRGMIEYKKPKGREALKRLTVFIGVPKEYSSAQMETLDNAKKPNLAKYMYLGDISKELGRGEGVKQ